MTIRAVRALPRLLSLCLLGLTLGGCMCAGPTARPVHVGLDPELRGREFRTIEVDLVFVQENQLSIWQEKDMIDYFAGGDSLRRDESRKTTLVFTPDGPSEQIYGDESAEIVQMGRWIQEGATHMFIMTRLPEHERLGRRAGASDPRRQCLPLSGCAWEEAGVEEQDPRVTLRRGGVLVSPSVPCGP